VKLLGNLELEGARELQVETGVMSQGVFSASHQYSYWVDVCKGARDGSRDLCSMDLIWQGCSKAVLTLLQFCPEIRKPLTIVFATLYLM